MPTFDDYKRIIKYNTKYGYTKYQHLGKCIHCQTTLGNIIYKRCTIDNNDGTDTTFIALCDQCFEDKFLPISNKVEQLSKKYGLYPKSYNKLPHFISYRVTYFCREDVEKEAISRHGTKTIDEVFKLMNKKKDAILAPRKEKVDEWFSDNLDKVEKEYPHIKIEIDSFIEKGKGSIEDIFEEWEGLTFLDKIPGYKKLYTLINYYCSSNYQSINVHWVREQALDDYIEEKGEDALIEFPPYCQHIYKNRHPQIVFPVLDDKDGPIAAIGI